MLNHLALFHCCLQGDEDIEDDRNYDHESTTICKQVRLKWAILPKSLSMLRSLNLNALCVARAYCSTGCLFVCMHDVLYI